MVTFETASNRIGEFKMGSRDTGFVPRARNCLAGLKQLLQVGSFIRILLNPERSFGIRIGY